MDHVERVVKQIHAKEAPKMVLYVTGGGTEAIAQLLKYGGGSATFLEGVVNYCVEATHEILGYIPKHYTSSEVARGLAMAAYIRATKLHEDEVVGVGVTCKLKKDRERVGRVHKVCLAIQTEDTTSTYEMVLDQPRSREIEEDIVRDFILQIVATKIYNIPKVGILSYHYKEAHNIKEDSNTDDDASPVLNEEADISIRPFGYNLPEPIDGPCLIFPGSFNPVHKQHLAMAEAAIVKTGLPLWFEISMFNTHKPPIDFISLRNRLDSFESVEPNKGLGGVVITNKPFFYDKIKLFPEATFVVGADTLNRIYDPIYGSSGILLKETKFILFPRKGVELTVEDSPFYKKQNVLVMDDYVDDGTSSSKIRETLTS